MATEVNLPAYITESEDDIHARMLENANQGLNTVQGDMLYNETRPAAIEIAKAKNIGLKNVFLSRFPQTATGDDLDLCGDEDGMSRKGADYAIHKILVVAKEGTLVEAGKIVCTESTEDEESIEFEFNTDTTIDSTGQAYINATCLSAGTIGNVAVGNIKLLLKPIDGVQSVSNVEIVQYGVDSEEDESYRERILQNEREPPTSGNEAEYKIWCTETEGIGAAKVFKQWNGAGTVKCVVASTDYKAVSNELVTNVYNHIESVRPVGVKELTVTSATEKDINVAATITLKDGYTLETAQNNFNKLLDEYLQKYAFKLTKISLAKISGLLSDVEGIDDFDITSIKINGYSSNLQLTDEEIAVLGATTLSLSES